MSFWTYILRCADGSYYTGHTESLETRTAAHQSGQIAGYTKSRRPVILAWSQDFPSRLEALEAERRIKGWSRGKKEALIASDWERLSLLARNRQSRERPSTSSGRTAAEDRGRQLPSVRAEPVEARLERCPQ
ncbi:MAG: GIY-YIG nuclease family protein [Sphingomonas sp.]